MVNTRVINLIRNKVPINSGEQKLLFNSPELSELFTRSCYELDLQSGWINTYSIPPEDIGVACQQEEFDLTLLKEHFQKKLDEIEPRTDKLKRIPLIRKGAPQADIMDMKEIEEKIAQYCQLWELYAQASCKLTRRSKILQGEAAKLEKCRDHTSEMCYSK